MVSALRFLDFIVRLATHYWRPINPRRRYDAGSLAAVYYFGRCGKVYALLLCCFSGIESTLKKTYNATQLHSHTTSPMHSTEPFTQDERQILTVSQLNRAAKDLLDTYLPLMWVEGEISNFSTPSSGHWYFTLKDVKAQVRCAMFKGRNLRVRFKPRAGDKIVLRAKASLYEGRGDYQLIAEHMEPAGFGDLQRQFEALKAKLQAQGLFATEHKQALPVWPQKLGVITSATGAAVHDVLNVLKRRFPSLPVVILPVAVQGADAAAQIADAIATANQHKLCDTLLITRGGGSMEDLWAFNEEIVAQAIYHSEIPIISAVGHEVDFTIADFVADQRAATPSVAAELISANQEDLQQALVQHLKTLSQAIKQRLHWDQQRLTHARARLRHPGQVLASQAQALDQIEMRMAKAIQVQLTQYNNQLTSTKKRLEQVNPRKNLDQKQTTVRSLSQRLKRATAGLHEQKQQRLNTAMGLLHGVSPLNTLNRGYSILMNQEGQAVRSSSNVNVGDKLSAQLNEGCLQCEVVGVDK